MSRVTILLFFCIATYGCGGAPGQLANPTQAADALEDDSLVVVQTEEGYLRMGLDGSHKKYLTRGDQYPLAVSADWNVLAISNSDTDLFVRDLRYTGEPREVVSYRGRLGSVAVSPDGKLLAATRHADFSTPQSTWSDQEDNSVDIISVGSLEVVKTIDATEKGWNYSNLWFGPGGLLYTGGAASEVIDPETGVRKKAAPDKPELLRLRNMPKTCGDAEVRRKGWRGDEGLELVRNGEAEHLVVIKGRERGFHDYQPTVKTYFFVPSCKYVVFEFRNAIYAVELATKKVTKVASGDEAFLASTGSGGSPDGHPR